MKESKYLEEKNALVDIVHCAFNDWDDYNEECYESHISPQEEVEDFVADAVLHAGYRKQEWISIIVFLTSVAVSFLPISPIGISTISAGAGLLGGLIIGVVTSA